MTIQRSEPMTELTTEISQRLYDALDKKAEGKAEVISVLVQAGIELVLNSMKDPIKANHPNGIFPSPVCPNSLRMAAWAGMFGAKTQMKPSPSNVAYRNKYARLALEEYEKEKTKSR